MASFQRYILLSFLLSSILLINHIVTSEDDHDHDNDHDNDRDHEDNNILDEEDNLIQAINAYRSSLKLTNFTENERQECLADERADQLQGIPCTTVQTTRPQLSNYPTLLARCGVNISNILDGVILSTCIPTPNQLLNDAYSAFIKSPDHLKFIEDPKYTNIGIGSEDNWVVVVLTTTTPGVVAGGGGGIGGRGGAPGGDDIDDEKDEEDILHQGLNTFRTSLNLTNLTENDKAECLADEIADQFNDQLCATAKSYDTPGSEPQFANYQRILAKCDVNVAATKDAIILPVCVPNLVPDQLLSNYTLSRYSEYVKDPKFTGIGIGTENNWAVVVLTTSTPGGNFIASQNVGNTNLGATVDPIYHLVFLVIGFMVVVILN